MSEPTDLEAWDPIGNWLLRFGVWDDDGYWSDSSLWLDSGDVWTALAEFDDVWTAAPGVVTVWSES